MIFVNKYLIFSCTYLACYLLINSYGLHIYYEVKQMRILSTSEVGAELEAAKSRLKKLPHWKLSEKLALELRLKQLSAYFNDYKS